MPLPWLKKVKTVKGMRYRRTLADKGKRIEPEEILGMIVHNHWIYGVQNRAFYQLRDMAFASLEYILAGRCGEICRHRRGTPGLMRQQFEERTSFLIVKEYRVEKNKENPIRDDWALPKKGKLGPFTEIVLDYFSVLPEDRRELFPFQGTRAYQIIKAKTGKWNHWLRAMGEAYYMRYVFKDPVKCASALRLKRSDTLIEYVPYNWQDYAKELSA